VARYVLGINCYLHDSSCALLKDDRVVFASEEERFSRIKKDARFPRRAIRAALDYAGIELSDLDAVGFGWNRGGLTPLHTLRCTLTGHLPLTARYVIDSLLGIPREIHNGNGLRTLERLFGPVDRRRVIFVDHHDAHAWSAYALSGFDEGLVLVVDGRGAVQSTSIYHGRAGALKRVKMIPFPNSLGAFYEGFTDLLGFERYSDEWKVMGLAAYGQPTVPLHDCIRMTRGGYQINERLLCGKWWQDLSPLVKRFGPRRNPEKHITEGDRNLAASVQRMTEEAMVALVQEGVRLTGCRNLCLAGGVAMNSKANGKILASGIVDRIFIQPAATDDGTAIGAAIGALARLGRPVPQYELEDACLGPEFGDEEIERALCTYKISAVRVPNIEAVTARLLADGHIVGWFQGRMEFGPRALGNRSILCDPRDPAMRDKVNDCVKFREQWRPFAPSCLAERMSEYFHPACPSPFMILTFDVRPEKSREIPAVTHADNSARVQTVKRQVNPRYWRLIDEFAKITGVPVLLNTSFNLRGEPIVCSPTDAVRTFYSSGLDFLVLGDFLVAKEPMSHCVTDATLVLESAEPSRDGGAVAPAPAVRDP